MTDFAEVQMKRLRMNALDLYGKVGAEMNQFVTKALVLKSTEGYPELTVHIMSNGGSVSQGLDIYDLLTFYPGKKVGVVHGMAASMAAVILQACDERLATPHAKILIHHISSNYVSLDTLRDEQSLKKFRESMEADQERIYKVLGERTKKSRDEIMATCKIDVPMGVEEALKFGLIDKVIAKLEKDKK